MTPTGHPNPSDPSDFRSIVIGDLGHPGVEIPHSVEIILSDLEDGTYPWRCSCGLYGIETSPHRTWQAARQHANARHSGQPINVYAEGINREIP